ncbi:MAG: outer membrane lipoprotein carrier protein LolA [Calditrichaeota bacterium]|nr:MAG: outer membrane lipoprotein carrier protein LolA [Calditrichota bacterium]
MLKILSLILVSVLANFTNAQELTVDYVIEKMKEKSKTLETFTADFEQKKISTLFDEEELSSGKFFYKKKDKFLLDYQKPQKTTFVSVGRTLTIISESRKKADIYKVKKGVEHKEGFWGFGETFEEAKKKFNIKISEIGSQITIQLFPLEDNPSAKYFTQIDLTVQRKNWTPSKIVMLDLDEDITEITFKKPIENKEISDKIFEVEVPKEYEKIIH